MEEVGTICVENVEGIALMIGGAVVTIASVVSNFVGKDTKIGKIINWLGANYTVEKKAK